MERKQDKDDQRVQEEEEAKRNEDLVQARAEGETTAPAEETTPVAEVAEDELEA
jgi:small subunit ribosomal protein S2